MFGYICNCIFDVVECLDVYVNAFLVCIGINYKFLCVEFRTKVDKSIYQDMNIHMYLII